MFADVPYIEGVIHIKGQFLTIRQRLAFYSKELSEECRVAIKETSAGGEVGNTIVFMVGMPRSGTTLLMERLARHPDIVTTPETHFFRSICRTRSAARKPLSAHEAKAVYTDLSKRLRILGSEKRITTKRRGFGSPICMATVARAAFEDLLSEVNQRVLIEKTPDHGFYMDAISAVFPNARFIFLLRDPRDVALSWMNVPWNPAGLLWPAIKWKAMARQVLQRAAVNEQRFLMVRYEDFLTDSVEVLHQILEFLRLDPTRIESADYGTVTFDPEVEYWKKGAMQPIDSNHSQGWRSEMSQVYQFLFDRLLGRHLDRYGYTRADVPLQAAGPIKVAWIVAYECYLLVRRMPIALARRLGLFPPSYHRVLK